MSTPLLGDPASMSALGASLRRAAVLLSADGERLTAAVDDASPGWRGPRALELRRRATTTAEQAREVAVALDGAGRALQVASTDLAAAIAHLRELEETASARGLEVRDGTVSKGWGITGVADPGALHDEDLERVRLQERVHQAVTTLGRRRARLSSELTRASSLLARASDELRA